jgi:hypothetical protein
VKQCSALFLGIALLVVSGGVRAQADDECAGKRPWVSLLSHGPAPFGEAVRAELRAGLRPSNIDVCLGATSGGPEALAQVSIEPIDTNRGHFRLGVTDALTKKRVSRDLSLDKLPLDGRALALAVAAEELLRASWAELALRGVHSAQTAAPPEVRAVMESAEPAEPRFNAFGARLAFEHFTGGQTHYGADVLAHVPIGPAAAALVALGVRRALSEASEHGVIEASGTAAEAALSLAFVQRPGIDFAGFGGVRVLRLTFEPDALAKASAESKTGFAVSGRVGLLFAVGASGVVRSYSMLGAGLVLQEFSAADSGSVATGVSGMELFGSTGLALELP